MRGGFIIAGTDLSNVPQVHCSVGYSLDSSSGECVEQTDPCEVSKLTVTPSSGEGFIASSLHFFLDATNVTSGRTELHPVVTVTPDKSTVAVPLSNTAMNFTNSTVLEATGKYGVQLTLNNKQCPAVLNVENTCITGYLDKGGKCAEQNRKSPCGDVEFSIDASPIDVTDSTGSASIGTSNELSVMFKNGSSLTNVGEYMVISVPLRDSKKQALRRQAAGETLAKFDMTNIGDYKLELIRRNSQSDRVRSCTLISNLTLTCNTEAGYERRGTVCIYQKTASTLQLVGAGIAALLLVIGLCYLLYLIKQNRAKFKQMIVCLFVQLSAHLYACVCCLCLLKADFLTGEIYIVRTPPPFAMTTACIVLHQVVSASSEIFDIVRPLHHL